MPAMSLLTPVSRRGRLVIRTTAVASPYAQSRYPFRRIALRATHWLSLASVLSMGCIATRRAEEQPVSRPSVERAPAANARVEPKSSVTDALAPPSPVRIETLTKAQDWDALMLTADVPIRFDLNENHIVGALRKGTAVLLISDTKSPEFHAVLTGFPSVDPSGGYPRWQGDGMGVWLPKFVESRGMPNEKAPNEVETGEIRYGLFRELLLAPGGKPFSYVKCGKVRLHERDTTGKYVRVIAEYPAGELFGWIQAPDTNELDYACATLMLYGETSGLPRVPFGYSRVIGKLEEFEAFARKGGSIYWGNGSDARQCSHWKFERPDRYGAGLLVRQKEDLRRNVRREVIHYSIGNHGTTLRTSCPEVTYADGGNSAGGCMWNYAVVRFNEWHIALVRWFHGGSLDQRGENPLVAYRPDGALFLYFTREECERSTDHDPEPRPQPSEPK